LRCLTLTRGDALGAERVAANLGWNSIVLALKAIVTEGNTSNHADLLPIRRDLVEVLRPLTLVGRMQGMSRVPFNTKLLTGNVGGSGDWVLEGAPIPVTQMELSASDSLAPKRVGGIRVLTAELVKNATDGSERAVANDAAAGIAEALDRAFTDPANSGSSAKPASITYGATSFSSSGSTVAAIDADLKQMIGVLTAANMPLRTAAWMMSPTTATTLSLTRGSGGSLAYPGMTARGGELLGLPALTTATITASGSPGERYIALAEASEIAIADDGEATIDLSTQADLEMDDSPTGGERQLVSLWQLGLVGIRAVRFLNWKVRRTGAVAVLRDVTY
jgi:HK97 family phage major capsid protein